MSSQSGLQGSGDPAGQRGSSEQGLAKGFAALAQGVGKGRGCVPRSCSHHQSSLFPLSNRWMELLEEAVRNATRHPGAAPKPVHPPPSGPQEPAHQSPTPSRCLALQAPSPSPLQATCLLLLSPSPPGMGSLSGRRQRAGGGRYPYISAFRARLLSPCSPPLGCSRDCA